MMSKENPELPEKGSERLVQLWKKTNRGMYWNLAS